MTFLERYIKDNPLKTPSSALGCCPCTFGYEEAKSCALEISCEECWNREIPGTPTIKDSGERTVFGTGAVRDMHTGKGRFDLLPWHAIWDVSKHCENGAQKYGEHNVDKGIPLHSLIDSAFRHLVKYLLGWEDEDHLVAACWNLLWALEQRTTHPELNDLYYHRGKSDGQKK